MSKFAIVATFEVKSGRIEDLLPLLKAHSKRCVDDEPGTIQMDLLQPLKILKNGILISQDESNKVMLYEVYKNEAAFGEHWNGPFVKRIVEESKGMVKNLSAVRCTVLE